MTHKAFRVSDSHILHRVAAALFACGTEFFVVCWAGIFRPPAGISSYSEVTRRPLRSSPGSRSFHAASLEVCRLAATMVGPLNPFRAVQPLEVHGYEVQTE